MYYRDEDPNRTGDYDYDQFARTITGREEPDPDPEFRDTSANLPPMEKWEIDEALKEIEARELIERQKELDYFMKRQIDQFCKSSEQRDSLYKKYNLTLEVE
jgi:hypothetical protein